LSAASSVLPFADAIERAINDSDFNLFQRLILSHSGIRLNPTKKALLVGRLGKRVRELGLSSFRQYYLRVREDAAERIEMIDRMTTNETSFFREPRQFEMLENEIIPAWVRAASAAHRPKRLRVWSAGCSTGEEPYSLAAVLAAHCPDWEIDILATDISTRVLRTAAEGIWPAEKAARIPAHSLTRFFLEGTGSKSGKIKAKPSLRRLIRFARLNLQDAQYDVAGAPFDLVLCRNVLIYFEPEARQAIIERLLDLTHRGGYLFLGHSEALSGHSTRVRSLGSTVWVRR
jgi:chemotaxis protein methyltransferase CheR